MLPELIDNPFQGKTKLGDLSRFRSWDFNFKGTAYRVLYEIEGVAEEIAREAFRLAAAKLPMKTTFVSRQVM